MGGVPFTPASRDPVVPAHILWGTEILNESGVTNASGESGALFFDAILGETHTREAEVTEHSVESGIAIVDHVRPKPDELQLEAFVSDTPVFSPDGLYQPLTLILPQPQQVGLITGLAAKLDPGQGPSPFLAGGTTALLNRGLQALGLQDGPPTQATAYVMQFDNDHPYVQTAYETLSRLRDEGTILAVRTPKQTYFNMVLKRIEMRRDPSIGSSGAMFSLNFRQIRIVESQIVSAPLPSTPTAAPTGQKGKQDTQVVDPVDIRSMGAHWQDTKKFGLPLVDPVLHLLGQGAE